MDKVIKKMTKKVEDLDTSSLVQLLERWNMAEFQDFVEEKQLDGRKFMNVTEGIVKLWRPKSNANKLILFVQDLKMNPEKYLDYSMKDPDKTKNLETDDNNVDYIEKQTIITEDKETITMIAIEVEPKISIETIESQYQTVRKTKNNSLSPLNNVEELIRKLVPAKSFLYRNQQNKEPTASYLPMDAGSPKKRKLFRISGYDYPMFDIRRFSKQDLGDRGYYPMKRNSRYFVQKSKPPESRLKYKSLSSTEELKYPEDHFYEDLCYNEVNKEDQVRHSTNQNAKPYRVKIQELFQSFKMPFFKRNEGINKEDNTMAEEVDKEVNYYENTDSMANMYDSVHVNVPVEDVKKPEEKPKLPVEDYLEPMQLLTKDYCDVNYQKQKDDSLLGYIMSIFENRFGIRRETNDAQSEESDDEKSNVMEVGRWSEDKPKTSMADRPLPVPVENEPYYMNIDRTEAENLLKGQPDGTFVLRPSSQSNHAYTISVSCSASVHNVGVRRRPDGRLALGFSRRGERSFADVTALLRHHRKRRLLLVANGGVLGATTLNESPQYYQTPCNIPVRMYS